MYLGEYIICDFQLSYIPRVFNRDYDYLIIKDLVALFADGVITVYEAPISTRLTVAKENYASRESAAYSHMPHAADNTFLELCIFNVFLFIQMTSQNESI